MSKLETSYDQLLAERDALTARVAVLEGALESIRFAGQDYFDMNAATNDQLFAHIIGIKAMARQALAKDQHE